MNKSNIVALAVIILCIILVYTYLYTIAKIEPEHLGAIGDSIGGILTPILTLFAAYFAYLAYTKEKSVLELEKNKTDEFNSRLKKQEQEKKIANEVDEIADIFEFLENRIKSIQYVSMQDDTGYGIRAIELFQYDIINRLPHANRYLSNQICRNLESCNEIFYYASTKVLEFSTDRQQKELLLWELILIYKSSFLTIYSNNRFLESLVKSADILNKIMSKSSDEFANPIDSLSKSIHSAHHQYLQLTAQFEQTSVYKSITESSN